jgi:anti-anti-sigma regulatory factor
MDTNGTTIELIERSGHGTALWARIRYDLDLATTRQTGSALRKLCAGRVGGRWVIVEFDSGRFVAVCGLRVLLDTAAAVRIRGGEFGVVNPPGSLQRMHALFHVGLALPLFDRAQAVPIFGGTGDGTRPPRATG